MHMSPAKGRGAGMGLLETLEVEDVEEALLGQELLGALRPHSLSPSLSRLRDDSRCV